MEKIERKGSASTSRIVFPQRLAFPVVRQNALTCTAVYSFTLLGVTMRDVNAVSLLRGNKLGGAARWALDCCAGNLRIGVGLPGVIRAPDSLHLCALNLEARHE